MIKGKSRAGFSLIELLLVVTILGTLSGGIYGLYNSSIIEARQKTSISQQRAIKTAIDYYFAKNNSYPPSLNALTKSYMSKIPDDPLTDFIGSDWLIRGPKTDVWISCLSTSLPAEGIYDVRSSSGG
jgi:prepilin-type N-terminal cleavage/methylation domain-containing protein